MLTTHPSIMLGSYTWDENRLPVDEFDIRFAHLREAMNRNGWAATLVYGDAREHAALAFFTNFIPRMRWALALIPAKGEPRLFASMSSRDIPAMKTMTWIGDVKSGWEWKWFEEFCATLAAPGVLATIGWDLMTPLLFDQIDKTIADRFTLAEADKVATDARRIHRPREIALIRAAAGIARAAGKAIAERWRAGDDVESAALAGERVARDRAAQDVRTLVSRDGGRTLEPYRGRFADRPPSLLAYVAVKYLGYWAECFVSVGNSSSRAARRAVSGLDTLIAGFKPDASVSAITKGVVSSMGPQHPVLSGSLGHRVGLSLEEGDALNANASATIMSGIVYALRTGVLDEEGGVIASAMVRLREDGRLDILLRSDPEHA